MRGLIVLLLFVPSLQAQDLVAKSEPRSPEEELKAFKLPPGFAAQLVASEPAIEKPMQIAFDGQGRLWAATSHHYPFAAEVGKGTDKLFVLSDFDANGLAKTVKVFDDKLNIPIGVLPLPDASVIVSEVGRILKLTDTDGDGKADERDVLFDGFGTRDTHGMTNSFTLMPDGWIYACHGYLNSSTVKGTDGHEVKMQSGHTFRFKADGSRIEIFTYGQVNPFGMCVDPWLNLYTADCHSRPMTQLIRGAYYDSFGKPHDGLGYAPHVINHMHGSTGLCGLVYYAADYYPKEWQNVMFVGNCVTSRINCDSIAWHGSTPVGTEKPDFLVSDDPWFRPVDLKLGPDGAIYVSDFYNRIIGHYEVDLKHPGRDKERGRIWRIVRTDRKLEVLVKGPMVSVDAHAAQIHKLLTFPIDGDSQFLLAGALKAKGAFHAQRAAVDGMTVHPHEAFVEPLLEFIPKIAKDDTHMQMAARIALRNSIVAAGGVDKVQKFLTPERIPTLFDVALAIRSKDSHKFLASVFTSDKLPPGQDVQAAEIIGRHEPELAMKVLADDRTLTLADVQSILRGLQLSGTKELAKPAVARIDVMIAKALRDSGAVRLEGAKAFKLAASFKGSHTQLREAECMTVARELVKSSQTELECRIELAEAHFLVQDWFRVDLHAILQDTKQPILLRSRMATAMLADPFPVERRIARELLNTSPYLLAQSLASGLAGDTDGAESLLDAVKSGEAPARLLQEKAIAAKLKTLKNQAIDEHVVELTKNLPSVEKRLDDLIKARAKGFAAAKPDAKKGKDVFAKNCAACHQLGGEGAKVGPHLDGVGIRGIDRLLEDTLDPNRNVDQAFRATRLDLSDGRAITGLVLREEGAAIVIADSLGKEIRVAAADVEKRAVSNLSAMPANVDTLIPEAEFYDLVAYLLEQTVKM